MYSTAIIPLLAACLAVGPQPADSADKPTDKQIQQWVDSLASPNPAPRLERKAGPTRAVKPANWDATAQQKVVAAASQLRKAGKKAIPFLIEHVDDARYCMTQPHGWDDAHHNRSVGDVCQTILDENIQAYSPHREQGNRRPDYLPEGKEALRKWWKQHQHQSLYEMQRESFDWIIQHDKNSGDKKDRIGLDRLIEGRDELIKSGKAEIAKSREWDDPIIETFPRH